MTTVVPHLRLSWGGTLGTPDAEIWTNTLKWANDQTLAPTRDALVGAAAAVAVPLKVWFNSDGAGINAEAKLRWIKLNYIQGNGLQRDTDTVVFDVNPAAVGKLAAAFAPNWISTYALTLRTGVSRGRGHAGRIFPPSSGSPAQFSSATGYLSLSSASQAAAAFGLCIRDVRNAMNAALGLEQPPFLNEGVAYDLVIISASKEGDTRPPQSNEVVSVVCDRVPDIQHRRSNRLPRSEGTTTVIADIP